MQRSEAEQRHWDFGKAWAFRQQHEPRGLRQKCRPPAGRRSRVQPQAHEGWGRGRSPAGAQAAEEQRHAAPRAAEPRPRPAAAALQAGAASTLAGARLGDGSAAAPSRTPARGDVSWCAGRAHSGLRPPCTATSPAGIFDQVAVTAPTAAPRCSDLVLVEQMVLTFERRL